MRRTGAFLAALLLPLTALSEAPSVEAVHRLEKTTVFVFGGVGYAGAKSEGESDFRIVFSQPLVVALPQFEELYAAGNPQGRSYALVALRKLAPERFAQIAKSLQGSLEGVRTMSGCIVNDQTVSKVADEIAEGRYDPWVKQH